MKNLKIFFAIALSFISFLSATTAEAVNGKDLVISSARLVATGQANNGVTPYKVVFTVRNNGNQNVTKRTRVSLSTIRTPLNGNNGPTIFKDYLVVPGVSLDSFEASPIGAGGQRAFTAYIPNGLASGFRYEMEIKVDACLNSRDDAPCRVVEASEINNSFRLPNLTLRNPIRLPNHNFIPLDKKGSFQSFNPKFKPDLVVGKDLIITEAKMIANGAVRNRTAPYKVSFKVKNQGTQDVTKRTRVVLALIQYPLRVNNGGTVIKSYLVDRSGSNFDNFEVSSIKSNQTKSFTAYVPNGLPTGYRYELEVKVDACLNERDNAPCRVVEVSEINNHFRLPELSVR